MEQINIEEFAKCHKVGFCRTPNKDSTPILSVGSEQFIAPLEVDLRGYETKTEDQGSLPYCAAFTAAGFTENVKWRVNGYPKQIDPNPIYAYAKRIDGSPNTDGTTLNAVCDALRHFGYFDPDKCKTRLIWGAEPNSRENLKFAIHRYGVALGGFNITSEWYEKCEGNEVIGRSNTQFIGGHAVVICGYNPQGVVIHNSWGLNWGKKGFAIISWPEFDRQFVYAAVLTNALDGLK